MSNTPDDMAALPIAEPFHDPREPGNMPAVGGLGPGFEGGDSVAAPVPPPGSHPAASEAQPLKLRQALTYSSGNFGAGVFYSFNNFILPIYLKSFGASNVLIGLLSSTRSLEGSVIQPTVGAWSDRTWTRLGRRRPFIVSFVPLCVFFLVLTPFLAPPPHAPTTSGEWTLPLVLAALGIFLFSVTFNVMYDPYNSLLADITPERQRGRVNGVFQAAGAFGQVAILLVGALLGVDLRILFLITAGTLLAFFLPTVLGIREPRNLPGITEHRRYTARDYWNGLRSDPQVQLYFAVQFFLWFGINAITPFLTLYAINEAGFSEEGALLLSLMLLLSTALFVWPFGVLGDRMGLRRVFLLGMICMAGASTAGIFTHNALLLFIIVTIAGIGNAAQTASSFPLLTRMVFPDQMGLYTGLNTAVTSVAAPLSAFIAGELIDHLGYAAMFPFVAAMFIISLLPLAILRIEKSRAAQARAKQLEQRESSAA
ncbi:MAG: MFS transporter [Nitrososphaerota archaeon]